MSAIFSSKILLFGEYTVLLGSKALAIPYSKYSGMLEFFDPRSMPAGQIHSESNKTLKLVLDYLKLTIRKSLLFGSFDTDRMESDIKSGLYFNSTIPVGCGLGSSGALVAAIYERYVKKADRANHDNILNVKNNLAYIESFFHKTSSGIDPLVSFYNLPLLSGKGTYEVKETPVNYLTKYNIKLVDTEIKRTTGNLVAEFVAKCENTDYKTLVEEEYIPSNDCCIDAIIQGDGKKLFDHLKTLSYFQFKHLKWLIPSPMLKKWENGLENGIYYKLCGAGGGGFLLQFMQNEYF